MRALDARPHDRTLMARRQVRPPPLQLRRLEVANGVEERGLESREGEVETRDARDREVIGGRIALLRKPVDLGAAGVTEAEQPGALVERLARRVVERRAEDTEGAMLGNVGEERVPAPR